METISVDSSTKVAPIAVYTVNGQSTVLSEWNIDQNLTDRWGDINWHDKENKPLDKLCQTPGLLDRLRGQMFDELTFVVRKDGVFGLLFEMEFCSKESEDGVAARCEPDADWYARLLIQADLMMYLRSQLPKLAAKFPGIDVAVTDSAGSFNDRPVVWAFVADGQLTDKQRYELGMSFFDMFDA